MRAVLLLWLAGHGARSSSDPRLARTNVLAGQKEPEDLEKLIEKQIESNNTTNFQLPTSINNVTENKLWHDRDNASRDLHFGRDFHSDDEDIRTDSKNAYDVWPLFYYNPYEYEPMKANVEVEKAKDKRFTVPKMERIIPVHENVSDAVVPPDTWRAVKHSNTLTTDNPNFGNQPFFQYILNDYFDKTKEDPAVKELSWGKEFDHEMSLQDIDDYAKRMRRLEAKDLNDSRNTNSAAEHESINSKSHNSQSESETSGMDDYNEHRRDEEYKYNGENYRGFKDFADSFANRFGLEDHDRFTNYSMKNNADKGEKKKGFRKVYHKDEYLEHHDFFDNTENNENIEDKGSSKVKVGGSEAVLRSQAAAATGQGESKISKDENIERKHSDSNHKNKEQYNGISSELKHFRDIAKNTALSNNADYVDRYTA